MEARKQKALLESKAQISPALAGRTKQLARLERAFSDQETKAQKQSSKVGNSQVKNQYRLQWSKTLNSVKKHSSEAAEFLSTSAGLFYVEESQLVITVTVEVLEEGLKVFRSQIKQPELNACFAFGFGKPTKVMFRLPVALVSVSH
jgi:hypothetical protein